jgi:quinol monooxygenase YgiN
MLIFWTAVATVINLLALIHIVSLRRKYKKAQKIVKHLSRSIEKLNSRNGHLWYQLAQSKSIQFDLQQDTQTGLTTTKI